MSSIVPFWASTDSGSVPIWDFPKPRRPEEIVNILNDSCSHFTQRLFPPKVPQHTHGYFLLYFLLCIQYIEYHSYLLYITFARTFTSLFTCPAHNFISSDLPGRLSARGFLSPFHYVCRIFLFPLFFVLQRAFFYFPCTVSRCDGGNRTHNIVVYTWRFSPLSYDHHPTALRPSPKLSYDCHPKRKSQFKYLTRGKLYGIHPFACHMQSGNNYKDYIKYFKSEKPA
jgi:hypothetical protein